MADILKEVPGMPDPTSEPRICEICRNGFHSNALEVVDSASLIDTQETLTLCEACRAVYDLVADEGRCLVCSALVEAENTAYRIELTFPANDQLDGPNAEINGPLCSDCAARLGNDILFRSIRTRKSAHGSLVEAIKRQNGASEESTDESELNSPEQSPS